MLLDVMMPEMDGFEVLTEMKSDTELREVPVIMVSALDDIDSLIRCIELGAADYLTKPFKSTLLKTRIDSHAERIQLKAQEAEYLRTLEGEKARAEELLATVLPRQIARILKSNRKLPPIRDDDVSLLFCDVVGFTAYAENHAPEIVFDQLEALIDAFERLADHDGLMKVKAIGDAIVLAKGLLSELDDPVRATAAAAMDMTEAGRHRHRRPPPGFEPAWRSRSSGSVRMPPTRPISPPSPRRTEATIASAASRAILDAAGRTGRT